jgi:hypothetical protein
MSDKDRYDEVMRGMRRDNIIFLALLTFLAAAALVEYWLGVGVMAFYLTVLMAVAIAVIAVLRMMMVPQWVKHWHDYVQDERIKKVDTHARSLAWSVTFFAVVALALLAQFRIMDLGTYYSLMAIFLIMTYSMLAFKWYYGRKGDVE